MTTIHNYQEYKTEAGLYTAIVIAILLLLIFYFKLQVPDPPISERGGGRDGKGKMMELAFAPVASENPSVTANTQPDPQETVEETQEEVVEENTAVAQTSDNIVSDNNSTDVIKVSEKGSDEPMKETSDATSTKKVKKKKTNAVVEGDLFDEGDNVDGGGDPKGNSDKGDGGPGNGVGIGTEGFEENGWGWAKGPKAGKTSPKNGEIIFDVELDENGKVVNVVASRYTVDFDLMQTYMEECYKLKGVRKNNTEITGHTKGKIKYTFKAR